MPTTRTPSHAPSTRAAWTITALATPAVVLGIPLLVEHAPLAAIALGLALTAVAVLWKGPAR